MHWRPRVAAIYYIYDIGGTWASRNCPESRCLLEGEAEVNAKRLYTALIESANTARSEDSPIAALLFLRRFGLLHCAFLRYFFVLRACSGFFGVAHGRAHRYRVHMLRATLVF